MERYICIHGHFYQPPRENPWLEAIELQESAHPYHDWNERITAECYAPNATSRILDDQGRIVQMVNNYARISFNVGPTLLAWMEKYDPWVYGAILRADAESQRTFSGHGSALAQAYNHMILPLANRRDKQTQVRWGIRDFEHRFRRRPEGMWLPETAVDLETLEILEEQGILFAILAQHQAKRIRRIGDKAWHDVSGGKIDPTMAYRLRLPSSRNIALFFYDGAISRAVAFEKLLSSGESFVQRLIGSFSEKRPWPQMVQIATDGESYGHHHRFGDMALAYALNVVEAKSLARLVNYGEYLEKNPPTYEVEIFEHTSWSCAHGVERWRGDCGCNTGAHPGWNQAWRKYLREALDWLCDIITPMYEEKGRKVLKDPWQARDGYIDLILDRSPENRERFFNLQGAHELEEAEKCTALKLLELQRHAMLMYTSCGWFFDELSGIETIQVMRYAGRVLQLAQESFGNDLEQAFLERLERARSNIRMERDGRAIYEKYVRPAKADLMKVGAHYAMSSLFKEYDEHAKIHCYKIDQEDYHVMRAGKAVFAAGKANFLSEVTCESALLCVAVLHLGDHNMSCGVMRFTREESYQTMVKEVSEAFNDADFPQTIRLLDKFFEKSIYTLKSLFRDEQSEIIGLILESTLADAEATYRHLYEEHIPMIRFLTESGNPLPKALHFAAEFVLNADLYRAFKEEEVNAAPVQALLDAAKMAGVTVKADDLEFAFRKNLEFMAERFSASPSNTALLLKLENALQLLDSLPFQVNLWTVQNFFYDILHTIYPDQRRRAEDGDKSAQKWVQHYVPLCERLSLRIP
ncbi:MAG: DUF3536 domain-containing protein [Desulfobacteraceae bacterium]|jgi:alpha-amylase/alpha-mannosidase (GH57 family)